MSADLDQLILDLASPDPTVRDDNAFVALATAATDGSLDTHDRRRLGDAMVQRLGHPAPYARSFAPLVLASLARGWDSADSAWPSAWTESIQTWWVGETDLRGYDPSVGWIHAMAHGADAIGALGRYGHAPSTELLKTVGERLVAPTEFVWRDQEDDRIAAAVIAVLQGDPDHANLTPMLTPIARLVPDAESSRTSVAAANAMRSLRSLYVALEHPVIDQRTERAEVLPGAAARQRELSIALEPFTPWLFANTPG